MTTPLRVHAPDEATGSPSGPMAPGSLAPRIRALLCSTLLVPCVLAVCVQVAGAKPSPLVERREHPLLVFEQYQVDLGRVPAVREVGGRYTFRNVGPKPIRIRELKPSCGCLQPQIAKRIYAPGESGTFLLRTLTAQQSPGAREFTVSVIADEISEEEAAAEPQPAPGGIVPVVAQKPIPETDAKPAAEVELTFRAIFSEKQVFVRPRAMIFYQLSEQPTRQELMVIDQRDAQIEITRIVSSTPLVTAELIKSDVDEDGAHRYHLAVTVAGKVPSGRTRAVLNIETNDPAYKTLQVPMIIQGPEGSATPNVSADRKSSNWRTATKLQ